MKFIQYIFKKRFSSIDAVCMCLIALTISDFGLLAGLGLGMILAGIVLGTELVLEYYKII